jgi:uncharacterized lipoprotein YehR (DUF1307 family)
MRVPFCIVEKMALAVVALTCICGIAACGEAVGNERAVKALEDEGYSDVRITGKHGVAPAWFGCSSDDAVAFDANAVNPKGAQVALTVCCGLVVKACTVRH